MKDPIKEMKEPLLAIEEIWDIITTDCDNNCGGCKFENDTWCFTHYVAEHLYNAGYRKQKEGEWIENPIDNYDGEPSGLYYVCSVCHTDNGFEDAPFCPNCGAKMKGGAE